MKAARVGDHIEIIDGIFKELRGTIVRMNKRRKKVCVSLDTQGIPMQIWLSYELVEEEEQGTEGADAASESPSQNQLEE